MITTPVKRLRGRILSNVEKHSPGLFLYEMLQRETGFTCFCTAEVAAAPFAEGFAAFMQKQKEKHARTEEARAGLPTRNTH